MPVLGAGELYQPCATPPPKKIVPMSSTAYKKKDEMLTPAGEGDEKEGSM
jgi:hypothetical protein